MNKKLEMKTEEPKEKEIIKAKELEKIEEIDKQTKAFDKAVNRILKFYLPDDSDNVKEYLIKNCHLSNTVGEVIKAKYLYWRDVKWLSAIIFFNNRKDHNDNVNLPSDREKLLSTIDKDKLLSNSKDIVLLNDIYDGGLYKINYNYVDYLIQQSANRNNIRQFNPEEFLHLIENVSIATLSKVFGKIVIRCIMHSSYNTDINYYSTECISNIIWEYYRRMHASDSIDEWKKFYIPEEIVYQIEHNGERPKKDYLMITDDTIATKQFISYENREGKLYEVLGELYERFATASITCGKFKHYTIVELSQIKNKDILKELVVDKFLESKRFTGCSPAIIEAEGNNMFCLRTDKTLEDLRIVLKEKLSDYSEEE